MRAHDQLDVSSSALARTSLIVAAVIAIAGSLARIFGTFHGASILAERVLVTCGFAINVCLLIVLTAFRRVTTQLVTRVATLLYGLYLSVGLLIALFTNAKPESALIYLPWFFPLLLVSRLVNSPAVGRFASWFLVAIPIVILGTRFDRVLQMGSRSLIAAAVTACLSYVLFALMLNAVLRYREAYIVESERAKSLTTQAQVLESISDCFISMDSDLRLTYANDAACLEAGIKREDLLGHPLRSINRGFFPESLIQTLTSSSGSHASSIHEIRNEAGQWYEMRCFSHPDRISVTFRNITQVILARQDLESATQRLRVQSELLDKAQDAIYVQDLDKRILYWNKGAEALFGCSAEEAIGRPSSDIYTTDPEAMALAHEILSRDGDWSGEMHKTRRDGSKIIVESKVKLLRDDRGNPHSVLTINTDITARKAAENRIHSLAFHDHLTGLSNRIHLIERLEHILLRPTYPDKHCGLLFIDLDDFKTLNDTAGHEEGDCMLTEIARRIQACLRKHDTVARFGGDEFVVILEGLNEDAEMAASETRKVGEKILHACRQPYVTPQCVFESTASIGITLFLPVRVTVEDLLKRAELAMYQAKAQGRNGLRFFDASMETSASARAVLLGDMRNAIQFGGFELHFQPQLDDARGIVGCEALLRWRHPQRGMVSPGEFIPVAESSGLIVDLGSWVIESACWQLAHWAMLPHMKHIELSVNVSPRQFLDQNFARYVTATLADSGADPRRLKLEITESVMVENIEKTLSTMTELKALGISFSLDDFGTGYSSLSQLKRLPLDELKIDQSFVRDVLEGPTEASIVRTIIALAQNLGMTVIAEGVETVRQREFLQQHDCKSYQGYLFSPALPMAKFEEFVRQFSPNQLQPQAAD